MASFGTNRRAEVDAALKDVDFSKSTYQVEFETTMGKILLDVYPDGRAERVQDGLVRARFRQSMSRIVPLVPGRVYPYDIDVWFTSLVFPAGHRLRVSIASALFPKYDRNLNTGGNNERDSTFVVAHQRLLHDLAHPSHVVLPVVPRP